MSEQRFKNLEMQIDNIEEKLEKIPTRNEMRVANKELVKDVLDEADSRYAAKWTEKIAAALVGAVLLWALNQVLALI